ncbi:hypothetical protein [Streptomyces sp. NBC_00162]|uniref:hypothetical protein n=1 Tax=Streptomyces sp. NBC_00162 TaxID=2903629 RepID=UPI00214B84A2|nr:hypothetical protein [Streptomyces sp. NBC_00162]UUU42742.1 hypothetical protein JIW86_30365 [Streptomyces sp. NBC_00162]
MTTTQKQQPAVLPVREEGGGRPSLASLTARGAEADLRIARVLPAAAAPGGPRTVTFNSSL